MANTILIADDEPSILAMLEEYFSGEGYEVVCASDGAEVLAKASCGPDIILLDVGMPKLDGFEVCRRLREHVSCPIVFLTARVEDVDALTGFEVGGDDYVIKPFSLAVLGPACSPTWRASNADRQRPRCASRETSSSTTAAARSTLPTLPWSSPAASSTS